MATAQYDIAQGQDRTKNTVIVGGAISGIVRITLDSSKPKSEVVKALRLLIQTISTTKAWPPV